MKQALLNAGFSEQRFDAGAVTLNYVAGPDNGPALVLIPGQGANWETYAKVLIPLSQRFQVFALDIRGHGRSDWTTGEYSFAAIGEDLRAFLDGVVGRPAIISGNSSGGLIAIWLAANAPEQVRAIIAEDAPLFSAAWPRIQQEYVFQILTLTVEILHVLRHSRSVKALSEAFGRIEKPVKDSDRTRHNPRWVTNALAWVIRTHQSNGPFKPLVSALLPARIKQFIDILMTFDPDFSQAWLDGRIYQGLDHEAALKAVRCPMLFLHANWYRHPKLGLIGALDDDDAQRAVSLVPDCEYVKVDARHVIHSGKPKRFIEEVDRFASGLAPGSVET
jgi:pimeloyl-ACP methyl ester carboxylesterase